MEDSVQWEKFIPLLSIYVYMYVWENLGSKYYSPSISMPFVSVLFCSGSKIAFCILSNTCVGLGINTIALLEIRGEGVQWNNLDEPISLDDDFNLGWVLLMLIVDSVVYMLIAWCVCYVCMHACVRTCMCVYVLVHVCTCVRTYVCVCYVCVCM